MANGKVVRLAGRERSQESSERRPRLQVMNAGDLLSLEIPPRECVLEPVLRECETAMLHAWRGVGKTHVALGIAVAVATGSKFLRWNAPQPRKVLYLDGEMPAAAMQERLAAAIPQKFRKLADSNLTLLCADLQRRPIRSLASPEGQRDVAPFVRDADLVIVDSISTLAAYGRENEAESALPLQQWALRLRRRGKTLLLVHHDSKLGQQRGTSRREDILDLVIQLTHPPDYDRRDGARFIVRYSKARTAHGDAVTPFEARLKADDTGHDEWRTRDHGTAQLARAAELFRNGCKVEDVRAELGVSRSTAYRLREEARERGLLTRASTA